MRIFLVNRFYQPDISPTSALATQLCESLAASGHAVRVITSRRSYDGSERNLPAQEILSQVQVYRTKVYTRGSGLVIRALQFLHFSFSSALHLARVAKRGDVVIAMTDPPFLMVTLSLIAKWKGLRLVCWLQDLFPEILAQEHLLPRGVYRPLLVLRNAALRRAWARVAIGQGMAKRLRAIIPDQPIAVIPNWADSAVISRLMPPASALREAWALQDKFVVMYSGNLGRVHEEQTMLAAAQALAYDSGVVFLVVGGGVKNTRLRTEVARLELGNVRFQPYQPVARLSESLACGDVHWVSLTPQFEDLVVPSKLYGVLAAGRPVLNVGSPQGAVAQVLKEQACGVTVIPGDVQGFIAHIVHWRAHPLEVLTMGARARALFEAEYDRPLMVARWLSLLSPLESDASRPRVSARGQ